MSSSRPATGHGDDGDEREAVITVLQEAVESLGAAQAQRDCAGQGPAEAVEPGLPDDPEYKSAKKRAMNMLAARDHSSAELRTKLVDKAHPPEVVDALIAGLERSHLLDDAAFAQSFVRAKRAERALSKRALRRELDKKGVSATHAARALEQVDDEFDLAHEVALKKAASTARLPELTRKRRILGMLARRGFPQGICLKATDAALNEYPSEPLD